MLKYLQDIFRKDSVMGNSKFTMNGMMIIVIIFSAILFFFTVTMVEMVNPYGQNEYQPIEGTDLAVKHSSVDVNGLYQGPESTAQLVLEGNFGNDWGTTLSGSDLYLNKYAITSLGLIIPEVVRVDTETHEEEVLYKDAIIRGRCASGEMVILTDYVMPTNYPDTNPMYKLYSMSSGVDLDDTSLTVVFMDPETGEEVFSMEDKAFMEKTFRRKYEERTLDEIRGEAAA